MRRLLSILVLSLLVLPAAALAGLRSAGDGTFVVRNANAAKILVDGRGTIFGHFDVGSLTVVDYNPFDTKDPQISGCERTQQRGETTTICKGSDVRFLFAGGKYRIVLAGSGISISAVGKGTATLTGAGSPDDGTYAVNGGKPQPLQAFLPITAPFGTVTP